MQHLKQRALINQVATRARQGRQLEQERQRRDDVRSLSDQQFEAKADMARTEDFVRGLLATKAATVQAIQDRQRRRGSAAHLRSASYRANHVATACGAGGYRGGASAGDVSRAGLTENEVNW